MMNDTAYVSIILREIVISFIGFKPIALFCHLNVGSLKMNRTFVEDFQDLLLP